MTEGSPKCIHWRKKSTWGFQGAGKVSLCGWQIMRYSGESEQFCLLSLQVTQISKEPQLMKVVDRRGCSFRSRAEPVQAKKEVPRQVSWDEVPTRHHGVLMNVHSTWVSCSCPSRRVSNPPILHPSTGFPPLSDENLGVTPAPSLGPNLSLSAKSEWFSLQVDCPCFLVFISSPSLDSYSFQIMGNLAFSLIGLPHFLHCLMST